MQNRAVVLDRRPQGELAPGDLRLLSKPIEDLNSGQLLLKVKWLSLDPYMRPRMNDMEGYMPPLEIGEVIVGEAVAEVIESQSERYAVGDLVTCYTGWQEYFVANETDPMMFKIEDPSIPEQAYLGVAGMPGRTAFCGLNFVGKPRPGDTLVVAAATGPVGSVVGQLAAQLGCKVIGIAGGKDKCDFAVNELGFDACIDYKSENLSERLLQECPRGIDIYFENVGGDVTRAVAPLLNKGARVPICGFVSAYNSADMANEETPFHILGALSNVPEHRFFLVTEWAEQHAEHTKILAGLIAQGKLKYKESVAVGIEQAESAFKGMLKGKNFGKQLVKIAE